MNSNPQNAQFIWAMQRLAQMQGGSIDMLNLRSASLLLDFTDKPLQALSEICQQLTLPKPKILKYPDRVHLPLICYSEEWGWGLVIDRNPQNLWVLVTPQGQHTLGLEKLSGNTALLRIAEPIQLGFGLSFLGAQVPDNSFSSLVSQGLKQNKMTLLEACLASGFIGILSLATSLFSMQVYDRVIPVRSDYTLIILGVGVLITILIELGMKYARSHVMDHLIVSLDQRFPERYFNAYCNCG